MKKEEVYNYFTLKAELYATIREWIQNTVKETHYKDCPFAIDKIANIGGGQIGVKVDFQVPPMNDYIEESYSINIEDLENY